MKTKVRGTSSYIGTDYKIQQLISRRNNEVRTLVCRKIEYAVITRTESGRY